MHLKRAAIEGAIRLLDQRALRNHAAYTPRGRQVVDPGKQPKVTQIPQSKGEKRASGMASRSRSRVQYEPLYALAFQCFPDIDVPAGIDRQAVRRRKSTGGMSTETE
jgi:hypothetical protein